MDVQRDVSCRRRTSCFVLIVALLGTVFARSEIACGLEGQELADHYLAGMRNSRSQLHSGHVVGVGNRVSHLGKDGATTIDNSVQINCFFDGPNLRFDRREDQILDGKSITTVDGKLIRTDDGVTFYFEDSGHVIKRTAIDEYSRRIGAYDVRNLGEMSLLSELKDGRTAEWLDETLKKAQLSDVVETEHVCEISWVYPMEHMAGEIKRTIWIDADRGFTPSRLEFRLRPPGVDWDKIPLNDRTDITWEKTSNVWIPVSFHYTGLYGDYEEHQKLGWENVNGPVPMDEFDVAGMRLPAGTIVVDRRSPAK